MRVLLIAQDFRELKVAIEKGGYVVGTAEDGRTADSNVRSVAYDIIVLDQESLKKDRLALVKEWRRRAMSAHILVLAARLAPEDKVNLIDAGADCYVLKPNHQEELMARLRAIKRRHYHHVPESILRVFDLEIDTSCRRVKRAGKTINLSRREFDVLQYLALRRGKAVSRSMILKDLFEGDVATKSNIINVYISYLRVKIDEGFELPLILTIRGKGYMVRGGSDMEEGPSPVVMDSANVRHARGSYPVPVQQRPVADPPYQFAT